MAWVVFNKNGGRWVKFRRGNTLTISHDICKIFEDFNDVLLLVDDSAGIAAIKPSKQVHESYRIARTRYTRYVTCPAFIASLGIKDDERVIEAEIKDGMVQFAF